MKASRLSKIGKERQKKNREKVYKRRRSRKLVYGFTAIAFLLFLLALYLFSSKSIPSDGQTTMSHKAAIIDQLGAVGKFSLPNQTFVNASTAILKTGGFTVDYYGGAMVDVDFYETLAMRGYGLILLRVHSATWGVEPGLYSNGTALFTSESYSKTQYTSWQLSDRVIRVVFYPHNEGDPAYFGVTDEFVKDKNCMKGTFNKTMIIMMGCEGMKNTKLAEAFIERGASVYLGCNGSVSAPYTDSATTLLLQHLIEEKQTVKYAVEKTMLEIGLDPDYHSEMLYYPHDAGNYAIPNIIGTVTLIVVQTSFCRDIDSIDCLRLNPNRKQF